MSLPQPIEMEFRDGVRVVPDHVAALINLSEIDPIRYTYNEAVELSNDALLRSRLNSIQSDIRFRHFQEN
jgi:hypothetical protein